MQHLLSCLTFITLHCQLYTDISWPKASQAVCVAALNCHLTLSLHLCLETCLKQTCMQRVTAMQAATSGEQETSEAQGPNMQRFVQQLSGKV